MPAPRIEPGLLPALLLVAACASNRPEHAEPAARPSAGATLEDVAPSPAPSMQPGIEQLEESLAAYEQQLAHNESRLRAMGVRLAAADRALAEPAEEAARDERFAPPPPPKAGDAARTRNEKPEAKGKSTATAKKASREPPPSPRPAPQATAPAAGRAAGPAIRSNKAEAQESDDRDAGAGRCAELCDLAHATCELEAKICALAQRHTEDPRYAEVCSRASEDCELASEACNHCSP